MRKFPVFLLFVAIASAAPLAIAAVVPAGLEQQEKALEHNENGKRLLSEQKLEEAVEEFDKAIEEDETFWEPYYQRGRALANLGRMEEAKQSFLGGAQMNPAHAHNHLLAGIAALNVNDFDTSWDQLIRAHLAGNADAQGFIDRLRQAAAPPPDFDLRMGAWRVFVAGVDTRDLVAGGTMPVDRFGRNAEDDIQEVLGRMQPDLTALQRHVANAISDSPGFGVVASLDLAEYVMVISPDTIDDSRRPSMTGYLRLYEANVTEAVYSRQVEFRDLSASGQVSATLTQIMNQLESWRREREG